MSGRAARVARRLVSYAFVAFPRNFRQCHRDDALAYFDDRYREAIRRGGLISAARFVLSSVVGTVFAGLAERWDRGRPTRPSGGGLLADAGYGLRSLRRSPGFVVAAATPIALGLAGVTAVLAVVDGVLFRPLPYPEPEALVKVGSTRANGVIGSISVANLTDIEDNLTAFQHLGGVTGGLMVIHPSTDPEAIRITRPTRHFMEVFGLVPALGRGFAEEDYHHPAVALVTWAFWQDFLGGSVSPVGTLLETQQGSYRIVGVLPRDWEPPEALTGVDGAVWIPFDYDDPMIERTRAFGFMAAAGRLAPGVTSSLARDQLHAAALTLAEAHPDANRDRDGNPRGLEARDLQAETVGDVGSRLLLLLGAVLAVLAIACANVANLFLARGATRERELAMRTVMGAGRARLLCQLLVESVVVAVIGGAVGLGLAHGTVGALVALSPGLPRAGAVVVDTRIAAMALGVSAVCGIAFGLLPAWRVSQRDPGRVLRGGLSVRMGGDRLRTFLVVTQTALAVVLVVGGGLLVNSAVRLDNVGSGLDAEGVVTFRPRLDQRAREEAAPFFRAFVDALGQAPGVESVSGSMYVPGDGLPISMTARASVGTEGLPTWRHTVLPDFFETLRVPVLEGRAMGRTDAAGTDLVAVVSRSLAKALWPGESPIGRVMTVHEASDDLAYTVIGVAADVRDDGPRHAPVPVFYESFYQRPWLPSLSVLIRHDGDMNALASTVREALRSVNPSVPRPTLERLPDILARHTVTERDWAILLGVFSLVALAIAAVGVYATLSYTVARQLREMGIRRAVGARGGQVVGLVFRRGLALTAMGVTVGLVASVMAARLLDSLLFGVGSSDPATYAAVAAVLFFAAAVACALPAVRAARADPLTILRE